MGDDTGDDGVHKARFPHRTSLEAAGVPGHALGGASGPDSPTRSGTFSSLDDRGISRQVRAATPSDKALHLRICALAAALSSREGHAESFWAQFGQTDLPRDIAVLDLTTAPGKLSNGYVAASETAQLAIDLESGNHMRQVANISALPPASLDLLICNASWLGRISPQLLACHTRQKSLRAETRTGHKMEELPLAGALQRRHLLQLLDQFSVIVKRDGVCVLSYQHVLASAWQALAEALAASHWYCYMVIPWRTEMPSDPYLRSRALAWEATLVCRQRQDSLPKKQPSLGPGVLSESRDACNSCARCSICEAGGPDDNGSRGPEKQVVVNSKDMRNATEQMSRYMRLERKGRPGRYLHPRMCQADRINLWRALLVSQAFLGELTPQRRLLAEALQAAPDA